jgi:BirA family biotin operon repressor/biotin-[acetyl-CoA-carboxylase] ligase
LKVKWPNDVLIGGAKICGILAESSVNGSGKVDHVVLGIGINVASHPPIERIGYAATSLAALGVHKPVSDLLSRLLQALHRRYGVWKTGGFGALREDWLSHAAALGEAISVKVGETSASGRFAGIDAEGALLLEEGSGQTRRISAGEIAPAA